MAEEYTCIECENLYDDRDGETDERLCNKCLNKIYDENHHSSVYHGVDNIQNEERRDPNIKRSSTPHYPDWDKKKKIYIVPPNKRKINEMLNEIKSTPEYKLGKKLLDGEMSNVTIDSIIKGEEK